MGLNEINHGLLIRLFGAEQRQVISVASLKLLPGQIERDAGGILCRRRGFQGVGVLLKRIQRVSDILKGGKNRAAVLFGGLR